MYGEGGRPNPIDLREISNVSEDVIAYLNLPDKVGNLFELASAIAESLENFRIALESTQFASECKLLKVQLSIAFWTQIKQLFSTMNPDSQLEVVAYLSQMVPDLVDYFKDGLTIISDPEFSLEEDRFPVVFPMQQRWMLLVTEIIAYIG